MPKVHTGTLTVSELHAGDGVKADFVYCFSIGLFQPFLDTFGSIWIARAYLVPISRDSHFVPYFRLKRASICTQSNNE